MFTLIRQTLAASLAAHSSALSFCSQRSPVVALVFFPVVPVIERGVRVSGRMACTTAAVFLSSACIYCAGNLNKAVQTSLTLLLLFTRFCGTAADDQAKARRCQC